MKKDVKKLTLSKETVRLLNDSALDKVAGGQAPESRETSCWC